MMLIFLVVVCSVDFVVVVVAVFFSDEASQVNSL